MISRYAELTRELAIERARIGRDQGGRPEMSLRIAEIVEERARIAIAMADAMLVDVIGRGKR